MINRFTSLSQAYFLNNNAYILIGAGQGIQRDCLQNAINRLLNIIRMACIDLGL